MVVLANLLTSDIWYLLWVEVEAHPKMVQMETLVAATPLGGRAMAVMVLIGSR
jgi:hypothetical protein